MNVRIRKCYTRSLGTSVRGYQALQRTVQPLAAIKPIGLVQATPQFYFSDKPPKGFEKFYRRKGKSATKSKESSSTSETKDKDAKVEESTQDLENAHEKDTLNSKKEDPKKTSGEESEEEIHPDPPKDPKKDPKKPKNEGPFSALPDWIQERIKTIPPWALMAVASAFVFLYMASGSSKHEEISYQEFISNYFDKGVVEKITIENNFKKVRGGESRPISRAIVSMKDNSESKAISLGNVDQFLYMLEQTQLRKGLSPDQFVPVMFQNLASDVASDADKVFSMVLNVLIVGLIISTLLNLRKMGRGGKNPTQKGGGGFGGLNDFFSYGSANTKVFDAQHTTGIKFKDVAGLAEAKREVTEFVDFLKAPEKFLKLGAKIPRGALLCGPPGTGKTLLAKAAAGEAGVPFLTISGSDFVEMFVGVGASRVRDLFKKAREKAPSIIFIDEIDAVGRKRQNKMGGNDERDNTLNQLLVEMDGFNTDAKVVVLAGTNRKDILDSALLRPGRFDRNIEIGLPDLNGRKQILKVHLKPIKLNKEKTREEYAKRLATLTPGMSGADLANICNEAAILAARCDKKSVDADDFERAVEKVIGGLEKANVLTDKERKTVAYHEAGHALVGWMLEGGNPLLKVSIVARSSGALGFAQFLPNESSLYSKEQLFDMICCTLGGRIAEEIFFGRITTGAADDLQKIAKIARGIVSTYGMSEKMGYLAYDDPQQEYGRPYSEQTLREIDEQARKIVEAASVATRDLINKHKDMVETMGEQLLEKETLNLKDIREIFGERPFPIEGNFKQYLEQTEEDEAEKLAKKGEKLMNEVISNKEKEIPDKKQEDKAESEAK